MDVKVKVDLPFELQNNSPVDAKQNFKTLAEMKNFDERFLSDTAMCTCDEDGKLYVFNKLNTIDTTTGKWRVQGASAVVDEMTVTGTRMMLCRMCAKGREKFYKKHGFIARPTESLGPGMIQYIEK